MQVYWGPREVAKIDTIGSDMSRIFEYSKDGSLLVVVNNENVVVYNSHTGAVHKTIPRPHVQAVSISPLNNFVVTFERLDQNLNEHKNNLIVWRLSDVSPLVEFSQKNFIQENWPFIRWTDDETYFGRVVTNEIHLFSPRVAKPSEVARRIQLKDVNNIEFAPGAFPFKIAAYVPEKKGSPAFVRIYSLPPPAAPVDIKQLTNKSFFKSTSATFLWNSLGTAVLVSTSTDVDKTGKSYYGETGLYFMAADGSASINVTLNKEGPIHDVAWSPLGKEFVVTYGFMPAQSTLFDFKCNPVVDFGVAPRNTVRWAPNGKIVCLGGFGNLQGQMDFWDVKTTTKLGTAQAHCAAVCEWAPDSRHFVAAVVSPRIRVDNGYKIFRYDGNLIYEAHVNELYQVEWRPALPGAYPDRALSPFKGPAPGSAASAPAAATAAPAKYQHPNAAKYRHPNAGASNTTASLLRNDEEATVRRYAAPIPRREHKPEDDLPPGWSDDTTPLKPVQKSNKPKKPKKSKLKAAAAEQSGVAEAEHAEASTAVEEVTQEVSELQLQDSPGATGGKKKGKQPNNNNNNNRNATTTTTTTTTNTATTAATPSSPSPAPSSPATASPGEEKKKRERHRKGGANKNSNNNTDQ